MVTLTLVRGLPGSGKSTLARTLSLNSHRELTEHYEADMFYTNGFGEYSYDSNRILDAHDTCQKYALRDLKRGLNVVVSNTFTTFKEIKPYLNMVIELSCKLQVITCYGGFGSVHDVPAEILTKMSERFDHNVMPKVNQYLSELKNSDNDSVAVDAFAEVMKEKLAKKRSEGRSGWENCDANLLSSMLLDHVKKGDPIDVANFSMMLHQNGQRIIMPADICS